MEAGAERHSFSKTSPFENLELDRTLSRKVTPSSKLTFLFFFARKKQSPDFSLSLSQKPPTMRRALLLALAALLVAPVALAASPPGKGSEAAELLAPPAVAAPAPAPTAAAATAPPSCCDSLAQAGFKPSPGMPVIILTTKSNKALDTREKSPVEICTCEASSDGGNSSSSSSASSSDLQVPGLARVRGGVNTQRYNTIKQFAIYPELGEKKSGNNKGSSEEGVVGGNNGTSTAAEAAAPSSSSHSSFVGLPRGKKFVLVGQVNDTFSLKYWTGLELARRMTPSMASAAGNPSSDASDALIVPQAKQVELFVVDDGRPLAFSPPSQHYRGIYLITQHIDPALIPGMKKEKQKAKKSSKRNKSDYNETSLTTASASAEEESSLSSEGNGKGGGKKLLSPGAFISTFLHGERIDPDFSAFVEMPVTNRWAGKNKEWAVKYPDSRDVAKLGNEGRNLIDSIAKRYAAVEDAIFARGTLSPADFDSPQKVLKMTSSKNAAKTDEEAFNKAAHLPSWLDWFLLAEFTKVTKHAYHSAAFMYSLGNDEDIRLRFGPAWSYGQG